MLTALPRCGRVAELGTFEGRFAKVILLRNQPAELHLIDIDTSRLDPALTHDTRVRVIRGLTHVAMKGFPDDFFDWIYIDADHAYSSTLRDAEVCASKVKPGGFLVFNDFAHIDPHAGRYGVHRAVIEFATDHGWPLRYFAFDPTALYDVALERPK
jgi:SAM-dependent methyltransferase